MFTMILKSGTIIPFIFKDAKKLIAIKSLTNNVQICFDDVQSAVYAAFVDLKKKCEFYNPKIEFQIPQELFIPYLEQCHDLTNFVVKIIEIEEEFNKQNSPEPQKSTETNKRSSSDESPMEKQIKKPKVDSIDEHLENILKTSTKGQAICKNFESSNELTEEDRLALIKLVIKFEFENFFKSEDPIAIDTIRLINLSDGICRRFPGEDPSRYFVQHSKSLKYSAGGKLYEQFLLKKMQCMQMERNARYFEEPEGTIENDFPELKELREITDDWCSYFRAWQYTFELRMAYFRNSIDTLEYFEKLITNVHDRTIDLVEYDFKRLHPNKSNNLFDNWDQLSERIFTEALVLDRKDVPTILDLYGHMSELSGFMMLSHFIENYNKDMKSFQQDCPGNLVIHIEEVIENPEDFFNDYYYTETPTVFAIGIPADELNFYVVVGSKLFQMATVLKAVDFCFKCYQILQLPYPSVQTLGWEVIQNAFYDIYTENDCMETEKLLKILKNL